MPYSRAMEYVISHTSALEVMRLRRFTDLLARQTPRPQQRQTLSAPSDPESWLESTPMIRQLARPVCLLAPRERDSRRTAMYSIHVEKCPLPVGSILVIDESTGVVGPELLLLQMARIATEVELAFLVSELCGLYAIQPAAELGMIQRDAPLTTRAKVEAFLNEMGAAPGAKRLRRALALAFDRSGSPQETKVAARISWPRAKGGYGLPILSLNDDVELPRIERGFNEAQVRRPDLLLKLPSDDGFGVCLDYHGEVHETAGRHQVDDARANELVARGFKPYVVWADQSRSVRYMDGLIDGAVRRDLGLPRRRVGKARGRLELARREALLAELEGIDGLSWGVSDSRPEVLWAKEAVGRAEGEVRAARGG